jgi:hypothetical protein
MMSQLSDLADFIVVSLIGDKFVPFFIVAGLGYFVYGGMNGALAMVVVWFIYQLCLLLALIPFIGVFIQAFVTFNYAWPWVAQLTSVGASWLTTLMFVVSVILGIMVTIATSLLLMGGSINNPWS